MDWQVYKDILLRLGFINPKYLEKVEQEEKSENIMSSSLIHGVWQNLAGEAKGQITLNNLRIFLLAVMGTFVEPGLNREEQTLVKLDGSEFGQFNDFGDIFLSPEDVPIIQKRYQQLYTHRMQFEAVQLQMRKQEKAMTREYEFAPKVTDTTREIAAKYREKVEVTNNTKLSQIDWLMKPTKDPMFHEAARKILE